MTWTDTFAKAEVSGRDISSGIGAFVIPIGLGAPRSWGVGYISPPKACRQAYSHPGRIGTGVDGSYWPRRSDPACLGSRKLSGETTEEKTIDFIPIGLYQIGLHNSINAVLLFADNTSKEFTSKKQFQLVPSYSVLFKWDSRKNNFYNDFNNHST